MARSENKKPRLKHTGRARSSQSNPNPSLCNLQKHDMITNCHGKNINSFRPCVQYRVYSNIYFPSISFFRVSVGNNSNDKNEEKNLKSVFSFPVKYFPLSHIHTTHTQIYIYVETCRYDELCNEIGWLSVSNIIYIYVYIYFVFICTFAVYNNEK